MEEISLAFEKLKLGFDLKPEQKKVISNVVAGEHTCCVLPTGYDKSLCYVLPPLVSDVVSGII